MCNIRNSSGYFRSTLRIYPIGILPVELHSLIKLTLKLSTFLAI